MRRKKGKRRSRQAVVRRDHIALCMKRNGSKGDGVWILDSAVSDHIINRRDLFIEFLEMKA